MVNEISIKEDKWHGPISVRLTDNIIDSVIGLLVALCPILQHYNGFFLEVSSEILIILFPYVLIKLSAKQTIVLKSVLPLLLYAVYISIIHGFSVFLFLREILLFVFFLAAYNNAFNVSCMISAARSISLLAAVCIIAQYFSYYILGNHLQLVPTNMLVDSASQWIALAKTGHISVTGSWMALYRPSAFFLEPSHLAIYTLPVLIFELLGKRNRYTSLILTVSIFLSTSGIGIVGSVVLWIIYVLFCSGNESWKQVTFSKLLQPRTMVNLLLRRIFISSTLGDNNAIQGRTATGIRLLKMLSGGSILIGKGSSVKIAEWNISGFFYIVFQYGIIGAALQYYFYIKSMIIQQKEYKLLTIFDVGLSFFTVHTFASFYRLYFILLIISGYSLSRKRELYY